jgi:signal transduction histidine kinase
MQRARGTFILLILTVVLPAGSLALFGVVAIRNERAALESRLREHYLGTLRVLEQELGAYLDEAGARGELPLREPPCAEGEACVGGRPLDVKALAEVVERMAKERFPDEHARLGLEPARSEPGGAAAAVRRLAGWVPGAQDAAALLSPGAGAPLAEAALGPPLGALRLVARFPGGDPVAAESARNRALYVVLLVLFYATLVVGVVLTARALRRQARLAQLKTDFVSAVSHDLRTPLTSIRMFIDTLRMGRASPEEAKQALELIAQETQRLSVLIGRVLDWARLEAGRREYRLETVAAGEVIEQALQAARAQALGKPMPPIEVEAPDAGKGGPRLRADRDAIAQVLVNLVQNAVKYSPEGSPVRVTAGARGGRAFIAVADRGRGIARRDHRRIFESFYRADDLLARRTEGTGLGLAIARRIVEAHRGAIEVESEPGQGSTFTVWLPLARESAEAHTAEAGADAGPAA